jgi:hypothetical protein
MILALWLTRYGALVAVVIYRLWLEIGVISGPRMPQWSSGAKKVTGRQLHGVDSPVARGDTALQQLMCYIIPPIHFRKRRSVAYNYIDMREYTRAIQSAAVSHISI